MLFKKILSRQNCPSTGMLFSGPLSSRIALLKRFGNRSISDSISMKRLEGLEKDAERFPNEPKKQNSYLNALLESGMYWKIIERFENSSGYSLDAACARSYLEALERTGQSEKALMQLVENAQRSTQNFSFPKSSQSRQSQFNSYQQVPPSSQPSFSSPSIRNLPAFGAPENPLHVISKAPIVSNKERFWSVIKLSLGLWFSLALISTLTEEMGRGGAGQRNFSVFNEVGPEDASAYSFEDVAGVDEAKEELEEIVEFLRDPGRFTKLGGKLPKGVLLTGPPGTGKTLLARAIAGEAGVPFFLCSGSEFDEMFVGVGAKRVRELFAAAKKHSPCIIFIDEIDAVGSMRNPKDQQYAKMTLNQLLVEMDGFSQNQGIIVIGATNFPESLDHALIRPGRFDRTVDVSLPDVNGRLEILKVHTKSVPMGTDVKLDIIARGCPGFSGADLANLINHAALKAAAMGKSLVTMIDMEWARDRIILGAGKKRSVLSPENRKLVAYHEAGHAIMALFTPGAMTIHKATIMPRGNALGLVAQLPSDDEMNWTRKQLMARLDVAMGGRCAEELIFGTENITAGASSDFTSATKIARTMITRLGMGSSAIGQVALQDDYSSLSTGTKSLVESEVRLLIDDSFKRACNLLNSKSKELQLLAEALLEYETLSKDEIELIISGKKLDRPIIGKKDTELPDKPKKHPAVKTTQKNLPIPQQH